jgi:hypothetical protein
VIPGAYGFVLKMIEIRINQEISQVPSSFLGWFWWGWKSHVDRHGLHRGELWTHWRLDSCGLRTCAIYCYLCCEYSTTYSVNMLVCWYNHIYIYITNKKYVNIWCI